MDFPELMKSPTEMEEEDPIALALSMISYEYDSAPSIFKNLSTQEQYKILKKQVEQLQAQLDLEK